MKIFTIDMPLYQTFAAAKIKVILPLHFFPNSHGCIRLCEKPNYDTIEVVHLFELPPFQKF